MTSRHGMHRTSTVWRRALSGVGAGAGGVVVAAAIATGSAAPAQADLDDLFDPIISSLTDSIAVFDPAVAVDFTGWADELLDSLNAFDFLWPSTDSAFAAAASSALPAADAVAAPPPIPMEMLIGTEPAVYASIDGGDSVPLLVDTGSAGIVVPSTLLGDDYSEQLQNLFNLGLPTSFGISGYSGGVSYLYLTYDSVPVDYLDGDGGAILFPTDGPVNIEVYSYAPGNFASLFTNDAFQNFLEGNNVDGILGIGYNAYGPTVSPFIDYDGVLVDIPNGQLIIGDYDTAGWVSTNGAPISTLLETVNGATRSLSVNLDSGGVFGTIPSSLAPGTPLGEQIPDGVLISVTNSEGELLYSYTTGQFDISNDGTPELVSNGPYAVSGTYINSGVIPFLNHQVYLDYDGSAAGTTYFSPFIP